MVQRRRRLGDNQESAGSIPAGITDAKWSVGVLAAHLLGKEEDPVQLRDGPLITTGWHVPRRRLTLARSVRRVRLPSGPLDEYGLMVQWEDTARRSWRSGFNSRSVH